MSKTEPSRDDLDRDTITGNELANWLNAHGPEWVLEITPVGEETEYLGFVEGRFMVAKDDELIPVALVYISELADKTRKIDPVRREETPLAADEMPGDDEDEDDES